MGERQGSRLNQKLLKQYSDMNKSLMISSISVDFGQKPDEWIPLIYNLCTQWIHICTHMLTGSPKLVAVWIQWSKPWFQMIISLIYREQKHPWTPQFWGCCGPGVFLMWMEQHFSKIRTGASNWSYYWLHLELVLPLEVKTGIQELSTKLPN